MTRHDRKETAIKFWANLNRMKSTMYPDSTWCDICNATKINYSTFRSAKSNCSIPSSIYMQSLALYFKTTPELLLSSGGDNLLNKRRRLIANAIYTMDESTFLLVERLLSSFVGKEDI